MHIVVLQFYELITQLVVMNTMCRWYFGKIKRIEAEKKLLQPDNEHGSFLIRDSESRHHDFSLSSKYCIETETCRTRPESRCCVPHLVMQEVQYLQWSIGQKMAEMGLKQI